MESRGTDTFALNQPEVQNDSSGSRVGCKNKSVIRAKLIAVSVRILCAGTGVAVVTFLMLLLRFVIETYVIEGKSWHMYDMQYIGKFVILSVIMMLICLPGGLPLTVLVALSVAIKNMKRAGIIVRPLEAAQTMGDVTSLCVRHTPGILTTDRLTVVQTYISGTRFWTIPKVGDVSSYMVELVARSIALNSSYDSNTQPPVVAGHLPTYQGNGIDCSLLCYVDRMGHDYRMIRAQKPKEEFINVTIHRRHKCVVSVTHRDSGGYDIYVRSPPEVALRMCEWILDDEHKPIQFTQEAQESIYYNIVESMCKDYLRCVCLSYKEYVPDNPASNQELLDGLDLVDNDDIHESLLRNLTFICILGIEYPLRSDVSQSIKQCQSSGITVRLLSTESMDRARHDAARSGIMYPNDDFKALNGEEFMSRIQANHQKDSSKKLDSLYPRLRVIARSTPIIDNVLIRGIRESTVHKHGEIVAAFADDATIFNQADIGVTMGVSGTIDAKEAANITIEANTFASLVEAVMWGRHVYAGIAKFLQFQLTLSAVVVLLNFVSLCVVWDAPLKTYQFLWICLGIANMAAIALTTEPAHKGLLTRGPHGWRKSLISRRMLFYIVGHTTYQLVILCFILFRGDTIVRIESGDSSLSYGQPSQHSTMIFNTLVCMMMFNLFNCRHLDVDRNMFRQLIHSMPIFIVMWSITWVGQVVIVQFGGHIWNTHELAMDQWLWCIFFGMGELLWAQVLLSIPVCVCKKKKRPYRSEDLSYDEDYEDIL